MSTRKKRNLNIRGKYAGRLKEVNNKRILFCATAHFTNIVSHFFSKNHQRALESMQASLEAEVKSKAEVLRIKKRLESDISELEVSIDHSNKAYSDLQTQVKKLQGETREMQTRIEEEQRQASEYREESCISERRANALNSDLEEARSLLERAERGRRQAEGELADTREQLNELTLSNSSLAVSKRKVESEMQNMQVSTIILFMIDITFVTVISILPLLLSLLA